MGEFFNFLLHFKLRCFRGRKGVVAFSSLAGALFYLGLWGLERNVAASSGDDSILEILSLVIIALTFFSAVMACWNYRSEQNRDIRDRSRKQSLRS